MLDVPPLSQLRQRRSEKWRTYPPDVLPLPVAEMDFSLAEPIRDALHAAVDRSDTGYAVPTPDLGEALAMFADQRWGWQLDPDAVVAAPDLSVAAVELFRVLCRPGDAVVISPPVYPPFFSWVPEAGTRLVEVPLRHEDKGWRLDLAALERAFRDRPAAYLLCHPQNPVGRVHDEDELRELIRLAAKYDVTILSDEIHGPVVLTRRDLHAAAHVAGCGGGCCRPGVREQGVEPGRTQVRRNRGRVASPAIRAEAVAG